MNQYYVGDSGKIVFQGNTLADIGSWSIQAQQSLVETTTAGDPAPTYRYSRPAYSGSLQVYAKDNPSSDIALLSAELFRTGFSPAPRVYDLFLIAGNNRIRCQALFDNISYEVAPGNTIDAGLTFRVSGLLNEYTWSGSSSIEILPANYLVEFQPAILRYDVFNLPTLAFAVQFKDIDFNYYALEWTAGSFAIAAQDLELRPSFLLTPTIEYIVTANNQELLKDWQLDLSEVAISVTGEPQDYVRTWAIELNAGVFTVTTFDLWPPIFEALTYTGNGSTLSITGAGFEPSLVWTKRRSGATGAHAIYDSVRGIEKYWKSNVGDAEVTDVNSLTGFNADGFTLGNAVISNTNNAEYVSWLWTALGAASPNTDGTITTQLAVEPSNGLAIFTYTGTGANATLGHGLGVTPDLVFIKNRNSNSTSSLVGSPLLGTNGSLNFATNGSTNTNSTIYRGISSTTISVGSQQNVNANTWTYVGYAIASVAGTSKVASYTGTGTTDQFVSCGFNPQYVLIKSTSTTGNWLHYDTARGVTKELIHTTAVESTVDKITFDAGGFTVKANQNTNTNAVTYLYMAFR